MSEMPFSFKARITSFRHAFNGLSVLFKEEHNTWIHVLLTCFVLVIGSVLGIDPFEWGLLIFSIALVFSLEIMNSALERVCDAVTQSDHPLIKKSKALAAAAVLVAAIAAALVGAIIFFPKLLLLW